MPLQIKTPGQIAFRYEEHETQDERNPRSFALMSLMDPSAQPEKSRGEEDPVPSIGTDLKREIV